LDFRKDFNAKPEELWEPEGATYYNGELMLQPNRNRVRSKPVGGLQTISPRPRIPMFPCQYQPTTDDHTRFRGTREQTGYAHG
jgi:hypothetical protein